MYIYIRDILQIIQFHIYNSNKIFLSYYNYINGNLFFGKVLTFGKNEEKEKKKKKTKNNIIVLKFFKLVNTRIPT